MAKTPANPTPPTPPVAVAAVGMTTIHGYAIQVLAFIPIPKDDLRKQAEIPMLIMDIQEGKKSLTDLFPAMRGVEFRQMYRGQRVTVETAKEWTAPPKPIADEKGDETKDGDEPGSGEEEQTS